MRRCEKIGFSCFTLLEIMPRRSEAGLNLRIIPGGLMLPGISNGVDDRKGGQTSEVLEWARKLPHLEHPSGLGHGMNFFTASEYMMKAHPTL